MAKNKANTVELHKGSARANVDPVDVAVRKVDGWSEKGKLEAEEGSVKKK